MKYLIGNLKMNLTYFESLDYIKNLELKIKNSNLKNTKIGVAFSHDSISLANQFQNRNFIFGAQNIFHKEKGAYTGEVSIRSAKELKLDFVLIGHSERRVMFNETNEVINEKIKALKNSNIIAILCVGENRCDVNNNCSLRTIKNQIEKALLNVNDFSNLIISYEPIYCIGNGEIPTIEHIQEVVDLIHKITNKNVPILYGGSVCHESINDLLKVNNLSGFLVGGASLNPEKFINLAFEIDK
ncbi:triose-phosphate isomerase family protein [Metamycoplasma equirhinis]|uniref:Triosephosphate isomerase n=1 Tax=Metamycoplasma equirhinis TaxID=92402 RepID=A0ABZ0PBQ1_9BACT|nr:triose-phosphate isomerase family protein [Metamycoplasma equirhinis]TPD97789.1 triosephosphate isomerase [Metamycoplasma equirhinis]WPB54162.1 triose-phosphate isomerase family protein [Metamycoplasma equirhinis]BDX52613.1 triosephosphate isomerase [Metamycoplasma equirhinis]